MEQQKIDMFVAQNASKFPAYRMAAIKEALAKIEDEKASAILSLELADPATTLILSVLCGCLGVDRFVLGDVGLGILKLLTCGGFYIWWIIDMVNAQDRTREYNFQKLTERLMMIGVMPNIY